MSRAPQINSILFTHYLTLTQIYTISIRSLHTSLSSQLACRRNIAIPSNLVHAHSTSIFAFHILRKFVASLTLLLRLCFTASILLLSYTRHPPPTLASSSPFPNTRIMSVQVSASSHSTSSFVTYPHTPRHRISRPLPRSHHTPPSTQPQLRAGESNRSHTRTGDVCMGELVRFFNAAITRFFVEVVRVLRAGPQENKDVQFTAECLGGHTF